MGAALSAAVMPCTRVPVTITVSCASCAIAGVATTANAAAEVPTSSECLKFDLNDTRMLAPSGETSILPMHSCASDSFRLRPDENVPNPLPYPRQDFASYKSLLTEWGRIA